MEKIDRGFWKDRKIFFTGCTGFKGSWLSLWLSSMGSQVTGYSLNSGVQGKLFKILDLDSYVESLEGDIRDLDRLGYEIQRKKPEIVFHFAAQSLVRQSYANPIETYSTNVMGTAHVLEAVRHCSSVRAVLVVTSDKCYENNEWIWGYRESDPLGGYDPYSSSKGCAELVVAAFRRSFFNANSCSIATARSGNVIGGGDWSADRLVPDLIRAFTRGERAILRNPHSVRPWLHVLEPLSGYLILAKALWERGSDVAGSWNFGPESCDVCSVSQLALALAAAWGSGMEAVASQEGGEFPHEANYLKLDSSKARWKLGWSPVWRLTDALSAVVDWHKAYNKNENMNKFSLCQIEQFMNLRQK